MAAAEVPVTLFGNMRPPSHHVTIPAGSEWAYASAAWVFVAVAVMAAGVWFARRQTLQPAPRRALLWLTAGCLAAAYSGGWLWAHRDAGPVPHSLASSLAVEMSGFWAVGAAFVVIAGWRRVRGRAAVAGRSFALALLTLGAAWVSAELGIKELSLLLVLPGYLLTANMTGSDPIAIPLFLVVNVGLWWALWAFVLGTRQQMRTPPSGPRL